MELESPSSYSQQHATCPYPEPHQCSARLTFYLLQIYFNIIPLPIPIS